MSLSLSALSSCRLPKYHFPYRVLCSIVSRKMFRSLTVALRSISRFTEAGASCVRMMSVRR